MFHEVAVEIKTTNDWEKNQEEGIPPDEESRIGRGQQSFIGDIYN